MEMMAELTKAFGKEMAKIFSGTISEEEIIKTARDAYGDLIEHKYSYGRREPSKIEVAISNLILEKVMKEIETQLESDEGKAAIKKEAAEIIAEAEKQGRELLVDRIANQIGHAYLPNGDITALANNIAYAITNRR